MQCGKLRVGGAREGSDALVGGQLRGLGRAQFEGDTTKQRCIIGDMSGA